MKQCFLIQKNRLDQLITQFFTRNEYYTVVNFQNKYGTIEAYPFGPITLVSCFLSSRRLDLVLITESQSDPTSLLQEVKSSRLYVDNPRNHCYH